ADHLGRQPFRVVDIAGAGGERTLVVGDRLDTDIEGARRAGLDSLLVLTGVSDVPELLAAPEPRRPTYVAMDLAGLFDPAAVVAVPGGTDVGGWSAARVDGGLELRGAGRPLDALAALCAAAWSAPLASPEVRPTTPEAQRALAVLGLSA
ncbi:HAD hydrolase-like protein, partial [Micromonospora sp. CPCC 205714]|uniref:HAD hydrolase-like protein n=1 Tax=Micromonospora sp. CPCC 205714 TaxID=3122402 RepID=UPI002FEED464